jgi:hypothetical protein
MISIAPLPVEQSATGSSQATRSFNIILQEYHARAFWYARTFNENATLQAASSIYTTAIQNITSTPGHICSLTLPTVSYLPTTELRCKR